MWRKPNIDEMARQEYPAQYAGHHLADCSLATAYNLSASMKLASYGMGFQSWATTCMPAQEQSLTLLKVCPKREQKFANF
jgi:hypothetical protein